MLPEGAESHCGNAMKKVRKDGNAALLLLCLSPRPGTLLRAFTQEHSIFLLDEDSFSHTHVVTWLSG